MGGTKRDNRNKGAQDKAPPKAKRTKQIWTIEEDTLLRTLVEAEKAKGVTNYKWSTIATQVQGRSGKQCRERWFNQLHPDKKSGPWTMEEDATLFVLQKELGNQWTLIAREFSGRTDNDVKNRWYSVMRTKNKKDKKKRRKETSASNGKGRTKSLPAVTKDSNQVSTSKHHPYAKSEPELADAPLRTLAEAASNTAMYGMISTEPSTKAKNIFHEEVTDMESLNFVFDENSLPEKHISFQENTKKGSEESAEAHFENGVAPPFDENALLTEAIGDTITPIVRKKSAMLKKRAEHATHTTCMSNCWPNWSPSLTPYNVHYGTNASIDTNIEIQESEKLSTPTKIHSIFEV